MKSHRLSRARLAIILGCLPLLAQAQSREPVALPALGADLSQTSVSGISSGGFMAAQLATAYSASFMGVGVIAAGPYYCAGTYPQLSLLQNAVTTCMTPIAFPVGPRADVSLANARKFAYDGRIDPVENLARQRVYVFSGASDYTVKTMVSDTVPKYYELAGAKAPGQVLYRKNVNAGHSIIVNSDDAVACNDTRPPYINNCGFVQSHELLRQIYGADSAAPPATRADGELLRFDQRPFVKGYRASMDSDAYVYVPQACKDGGCKVHVALHGCLQGARNIGDRFYRGTGYNEYADTNRLIVLYPQAVPSSRIPANPKGCWDFFGYSDDDPSRSAFFTKDAPQMLAIMNMVKRLGEPVTSAPAATPAP
ncbi:MAG: poly(3-hydroxybutyrate) depolymerase [Duganella sp.]